MTGYNAAELVALSAAAAQMWVDVARLDECKTLEDYEEAKQELRRKAKEASEKIKDI